MKKEKERGGFRNMVKREHSVYRLEGIQNGDMRRMLHGYFPCLPCSHFLSQLGVNGFFPVEKHWPLVAHLEFILQHMSLCIFPGAWNSQPGSSLSKAFMSWGWFRPGVKTSSVLPRHFTLGHSAVSFAWEMVPAITLAPWLLSPFKV